MSDSEESIQVFIHPHALKHGLTEDQVLKAWENFAARQQRRTPNEDQTVCIGYAPGVANEIQMVAVSKPCGTLIYHAMTPAQSSVLDELGIPRKKGKQ